ncbi:MAG: hypothetical protein M1115_07575 [Actinobacteria bacterium]|nr:hypothetical protein [Actinomycetota bacterium]
MPRAELEYRVTAIKVPSSVAELAGSNSVIVSVGPRLDRTFQGASDADVVGPAGVRLWLRYPHQG